jgi:hypothetical protein
MKIFKKVMNNKSKYICMGNCTILFEEDEEVQWLEIARVKTMDNVITDFNTENIRSTSNPCNRKSSN